MERSHISSPCRKLRGDCSNFEQRGFSPTLQSFTWVVRDSSTGFSTITVHSPGCPAERYFQAYRQKFDMPSALRAIFAQSRFPDTRQSLRLLIRYSSTGFSTFCVNCLHGPSSRSILTIQKNLYFYLSKNVKSITTKN